MSSLRLKILDKENNELHSGHNETAPFDESDFGKVFFYKNYE